MGGIGCILFGVFSFGFLFVCRGLVCSFVLFLVNIEQRHGRRGPALFPCIVPVCFWLIERREFLTESQNILSWQGPRRIIQCSPEGNEELSLSVEYTAGEECLFCSHLTLHIENMKIRAKRPILGYVGGKEPQGLFLGDTGVRIQDDIFLLCTSRFSWSL